MRDISLDFFTDKLDKISVEGRNYPKLSKNLKQASDNEKMDIFQSRREEFLIMHFFLHHIWTKLLELPYLLCISSFAFSWSVTFKFVSQCLFLCFPFSLLYLFLPCTYISTRKANISQWSWNSVAFLVHYRTEDEAGKRVKVLYSKGKCKKDF